MSTIIQNRYDVLPYRSIQGQDRTLFSSILLHLGEVRGTNYEFRSHELMLHCVSSRLAA